MDGCVTDEIAGTSNGCSLSSHDGEGEDESIKKIIAREIAGMAMGDGGRWDATSRSVQDPVGDSASRRKEMDELQAADTASQQRWATVG